MVDFRILKIVRNLLKPYRESFDFGVFEILFVMLMDLEFKRHFLTI